MTETTTTRADKIREIIASLDVVGIEDSNADDVIEDPERYLLVEENVGCASDMQSHWFTTHTSLDAAGEYNICQEYAEDWSIAFAVDLDTGQRYTGQIKAVEWTEQA